MRSGQKEKVIMTQTSEGDIVNVTLTVTADVEKIPTFTMGDNGVEITVPIALYRHRGVTAYNVMETQYVLHPSKLLEHGGFIDIQLNYTINGAIRTVQKNYRIYNKEGILDDLSGSFS